MGWGKVGWGVKEIPKMQPAAMTPMIGPKQTMGKTKAMLNHLMKLSTFGPKTCTGLYLYLYISDYMSHPAQIHARARKNV